MILSILIPSLYQRAGMLATMLRNLHEQIALLGAENIVEILVSVDSKEKTTGTKRNELVADATGMYVVHVDDDDLLPIYYVEEMLEAAKSEADCFAISGIITTNGTAEKRWYISKDLNYHATIDTDGRECYHRYTNHITCVKREIASKILFPDETQGEDFEWATNLKKSGLLKTEYKIDRFPMYHYKFVSMKPAGREPIYYSQNMEDKIIGDWFGASTGTLLEIGSNDGHTLSQSLFLIEKGWQACCVEPSPKVFPSLRNRHKNNPSVYCYNIAIGDYNGSAILHDCGELLGKGDKALVSTVNKEETKRWGALNMPFEEVLVDMVTFDTFMQQSSYKTFDYISIDAEGNDLLILRQMDLDKLGCRLLCIEHNSLPNLIYQYSQLVEPIGFRKHSINPENIIYTR